jgi:hypothetical protein
MKSSNFSLVRYDADDGMLFDWKEERWLEEIDDDGNVINRTQEHLYAKTLFIGPTDSIENYIEVDEAGNATELTTPEFATEADYEAALAELGVE